MEKENPIKHNTEKRRFEMAVGDDSAFIEYTEAGDGTLAMTHTEVPKKFEGQGVGSRLVKGALDVVRAKGLKVVPTCPFVAIYI